MQVRAGAGVAESDRLPTPTVRIGVSEIFLDVFHTECRILLVPNVVSRVLRIIKKRVGKITERMQRMRRREHDGVDFANGEHGVEIAHRLQPVLRGEALDALGVAADGMREAQLAAFALHRVHEGPAPAAETDDCRPGHRFLSAVRLW